MRFRRYHFSILKRTGAQTLLWVFCLVVARTSLAEELAGDAGVPDVNAEIRDSGPTDSAEPLTKEKEPLPETVPADEDDPVLEPYVPGMALPGADIDHPMINEDEFEDVETDDGLPFAKGDMEPGAGLGVWGNSDVFILTLSGSFAYYVINQLAPGIELQYTVFFADEYEYPQSVTLLPFLKYVFLRQGVFLPFIVATGGREFQWAGSSDPTKGVKPTHGWIAGAGAGSYMAISQSVFLKIQFTFLYYWYDEPQVIGLDDSLFNETDIDGDEIALLNDGFKPCTDDDETCYIYYRRNDDKDVTSEPVYRFSLGLIFLF